MAPNSDSIMAKALADAAGSTRRKVQIWTDAKVLECLPGTDYQGSGKQRLYDPSEIKFAKLAAELSSHQVSIGRIAEIVGSFRDRLSRPNPERFPVDWLTITPPADGYEKEWVGFIPDQLLLTELVRHPSAVVINVKEVMGADVVAAMAGNGEDGRREK